MSGLTEKGSGVFSARGRARKRLPTPFLLIVLVLAFVGCKTQPDTQTGTAKTQAGADVSSDWFVDRAAESGLNFQHFNGMSGKFYMSEILAPGVGLLDYDNDGDLDVYLVQGQLLGTGTPSFPLKASQPPTDRLYRNDLQIGPDGTRTLRFTDVTKESGVTAHGYGMGIAAGDFNSWWGEWWIAVMEGEYTDTWQDTTGSDENGYTLNGTVRFDYLFRAHDQNWRLSPTAAWTEWGNSDHAMLIADYEVR